MCSYSSWRQLAAGQVENQFTVEIFFDLSILGYRQDRLFAIASGLRGLGDIDVEPPLHKFLTWRDCLHHFITKARLIYRSNSLLPVQ